jgi:threonine aldolase
VWALVVAAGRSGGGPGARTGGARLISAGVTTARGFVSDNSATIHPAVLESIATVNVGHAFGYGHDDYTRGVEERLAAHFGAEARAFMVFNGSGANVCCLRAACRPWQAVICAETAHINVDECGAPEALAGVKLLTTPTEHGKLTVDLVEPRLTRIGDEHAAQPRVLSISQCTELGTVYSVPETERLADLAHANGLLLHVDGARLANAAAAHGLPLRALTTDAGVDIVSFGGTKNGMMLGEAVIVLEPELAAGFEYVRKQTLQLASKMRFIAAQFDALLDDELWLECATHANAMAKRLAERVGEIDGVELTRPVETNAVFATLPRRAIDALQHQFAFYVWDEARDEVRWMCSWDTTEEDVDAFVAAVVEAFA